MDKISTVTPERGRGVARRAGPASLQALALALALALPAQAAGPADTQVPASDTRFLYEGRLDNRDPAGPVLIWQGSRVAIDFEGRELALLFDRGTDRNFFDVAVDGSPWIAAVPAGGPARLAFPSPMTAGRHHLTLAKRQEASAGTVQFRGIQIAPGARAWRPAGPAHPVAMEFIGDSITAGACDEDGAADQWEDHSTHDSELGYAALAAKAFRADYRNISVSGMGVVIGYEEMVAGQIWDRLYPRVDSPPAELAAWTPDLVFVNFGENDDSFTRGKGQVFPAAFTAKYCELVRSIRAAYPGADIVLLRGGMYGGSQSMPLREAWERAVARLEAADTKIHHFVFRHWSMNHPRVADHRAMADELVPWLKAQKFGNRAALTSS